MNDEHTNLVDGLDDAAPVVGAEAATLVPIVAEADGEFVLSVFDGDAVDKGDVVGFVQVDEDA